MSIDIPCKNILVLGNGFDLHHNLKTKYSDYIEFMERLKRRNEMNASCNENGVMTLDGPNLVLGGTELWFALVLY